MAKTLIYQIRRKVVPVESVIDFNKILIIFSYDSQLSYKIAMGRLAAESHKYKTPLYVSGSRLWFNKAVFKDDYTNSQESDKLWA